MKIQTMEIVCGEIRSIMEEYRKQEANGSIDTPGGLENMGDVWWLLRRWDKLLSEGAP